MSKSQAIGRLSQVCERWIYTACASRSTSPSRSAAAFAIGNIIVGGIDLNKVRMHRVGEAVIALSPSPNGFTAADVAARVAALGNDRHAPFAARAHPKTDRCPLQRAMHGVFHELGDEVLSGFRPEGPNPNRTCRKIIQVVWDEQ
jgi:hypothetical protein